MRENKSDVPSSTYPSPLPSDRQLVWHQLEVYGFLHFTVNTFTDLEWGYGDESPEVFNPSAFDADQIVSVARAGGLKGLILTCKHHDGFCLWPSAFTGHSVKNSPWHAGKGDVVAEIAVACARAGLKFGVYLSPWDRNRADYTLPGYLAAYRGQLTELLQNYGPIFEVWFDGANGGDGYYGGARETRWIDKTTYYGWEETWQLVRDLQPSACIFSDVGPDIRWVGNEDGIAGDPCWATLNRHGLAPGLADAAALNAGQRDGASWLPAECDVSIRPGWFYHASEDGSVKTPEQLVDLYYRSVGRGASLLLNLPPDRRGRIHEQDDASLNRFNQILTCTFQTDLARRAQASSPQAGEGSAQPARINDGAPETWWTPVNGERQPEVVLTFNTPVTFTVIGLREYLPMGQRVDAFTVDGWSQQGWAELASGNSIGSRRLVRIPPVTTTRVRLRLVASTSPALAEFALYRASD